MELLNINKLQKGWCIKHPKFGDLQYRGLATKNPFTSEPKKPFKYVFTTFVDEYGNCKEVCEMNGNLIVEVIDKITDNE